MEKFYKFLTVMILAIMTGFTTTSCSDDDDKPAGGDYNDYFMEVTDVSGGGLSTQECASLKANINSELVSYYWRGVEKTKAIYEFDSEMRDWQDSFSDGMSNVQGTLKITFSLKNKEGKVIKKSTLNITKTGCTLN